MISEAESIDSGAYEPNQIMVQLSSKYTLNRAKEVIDYVCKNKQLLPLLLEAHDKIKNYFPSETLFLEMVADPDETYEKELIIYISTTLEPKDAIERLDLFDESWWLEASAASDSKLLVQVEYE